MKRVISRLMRRKIFYGMWNQLRKISLYGMNYGVASGYADYSGELFIIKYVKSNIMTQQRGGVVFDIGANVGDWSRFVIDEYVDMDYNLYMFEPSRNAFEALSKNIEASDGRHLHQIGFGNKIEKIKIYYDNEAQGSAGAFIKNAKYSEEIDIDTIDNFCDSHNIEVIDFLKMDVQGYELNILKGAKRMLDGGNIKFIQFEFDEPNIENRVFFKDFWNLLYENYDIYHSLYNGLIKIEKYHYELENFNCMNYLAVRK